MIKDIVSFNVANKKFAIDLHKAPLILTASKYFPIGEKNITSKIIKFEDYDVHIINMHKSLKQNFEGISSSSKILVGEVREIMCGFLVDRVIEIINITDSFQTNKRESRDEIISGEIVLSDELIPLIDTNLVVSQAFSKSHNMKIGQTS